MNPNEQRSRQAIHPADPRWNPNHINTSWTYRLLNFRPAEWLSGLNPWGPRTLENRVDPPPMKDPDATQLRGYTTVSHQALDETSNVLNSSNMTNKITNPYV